MGQILHVLMTGHLKGITKLYLGLEFYNSLVARSQHVRLTREICVLVPSCRSSCLSFLF